MIHKLKYSYYTVRSIVNGKTKFRNADRVEGVFDFDTDKYSDFRNNYYNVVSDYLQDIGVKVRYGFTVVKL